MKTLKVFILGLLYGWLIKLVFDRIYPDNRVVMFTKENALLRERVTSLESQLATRSTVQHRPIQTGKRKDDLKLLKGIGPVTEKKLNEAGIRTFADLAQLTEAKLQQIVGSSLRTAGRQDALDSLISQARKLAEQ